MKATLSFIACSILYAGLCQQPLAPEFQVNTYTQNGQHQAAVSQNDQGEFVVVWTSDFQDATTGRGVFGQRFDSNSNPVGTEFQVNTFEWGDQAEADVAMAPDGSFVVVYESDSLDGWDEGIFFQRFDDNGNPVGLETQVNQTTDYTQNSPRIAMDSAGNFVVVWMIFHFGGWDDVMGRVYDKNGNPITGEFFVNQYNSNRQHMQHVAMGDNGDFVVVWASEFQDSSETGVFARRYDSLGNPKGDEFLVNTYFQDEQQWPAVEIRDDYSFIVTWASLDQDGDNYGVYFQVFDSSGSTIGNETHVNQLYTLDVQRAPQVASDSSGNFIIAWQSWEQDTWWYGVIARQYESSGLPLGNEFIVNQFSDGSQHNPSVDMTAAGEYSICWQSWEQDGSEDAIVCRQYLYGPALGIPELDNLDMRLFPNPVLDQFTIDFGYDLVNYSLSLVDVSGRVVLTKSGSGNSAIIATGDLAAGLYNGVIETDAGRVAIPLIKE